MPLSYEEQIIKTVQTVMPAVASIIVGKEYHELLRERPHELMVPHGNHIDPPPPEDELPHTKGGKVRIGGGSGFVVDSEGLILTNKHVVSDPTAEYMVTTASEDTYSARVLARDPLNDVAILKIEEKNLPTIPLGNSDAILLGQSVLAVGTALGRRVRASRADRSGRLPRVLPGRRRGAPVRCGSAGRRSGVDRGARGARGRARELAHRSGGHAARAPA